MEKSHCQCKKCGDEISSDTGKKYLQCSCGALAVDGSRDYVRVMGNPADYTEVVKYEKSNKTVKL